SWLATRAVRGCLGASEGRRYDEGALKAPDPDRSRTALPRADRQIWQTQEVRRQRGHGLPPTIRRRLARVPENDDGPTPRSLEHTVMQGEVRGVRDSRPLGPGWAPSGLVCWKCDRALSPARAL